MSTETISGRTDATRAATPAAGRRRHPVRRTGVLLAFALPAAVVLVLLGILPIGMTIGQSLHDGNLIETGAFVGLKNFATVLNPSGFWAGVAASVRPLAAPGYQENFWIPLAASLSGTIVTVFGAWALGLGTALLLRRRLPWHGLWTLLLMLPWFTTQWAVAWGNALSTLGEVPSPTLRHLLNSAVFSYGWWILQFFPFVMMMLRGALARVDPDLYEAARLAGVGPWRTFAMITWPAISRWTYLSWTALALFWVTELSYVAGSPFDGGTGTQLGKDAAEALLTTLIGVGGSVLLYRQAKTADTSRTLAQNIFPEVPETPHTLGGRSTWWRLLLVVVLALVIVVPIGILVFQSLMPGGHSKTTGFTFENYVHIFTGTDVLLNSSFDGLTWLGNSLTVLVPTIVVTLILAIPAGYVLSRGHSKWVSRGSLGLFLLQFVAASAIGYAVFQLLANIGLDDSLPGLVIVYVGWALPPASWLMAASFDAIPKNVEELAWTDGASVLRGFAIALQGARRGLIATGILVFLISWNEGAFAGLLLNDAGNYTLPAAIGHSASFAGTNAWLAIIVVSMVPSIIGFAVLSRLVNLGSLGGLLIQR